MKTLTKKTHIAKVRQQNQEGMAQVCQLLGWSKQQYCDYLFEQYCQFIDSTYPGFPDILTRRVLYSPLFRGLFNNNSAKLDQSEFLPFAIDVTTPLWVVTNDGELMEIETIPIGSDYLADEWMHIHSHKRLMDDQPFIDQFNHVLTLLRIA